MSRVIDANAGERIKSALTESREGESKSHDEKSFGWSKSEAPADDRSRVSFICI
jgi:hypothetical protein